MFTISKALFWSVVVCLFALPPLANCQQTPTYSVNVKVVNVLATARDKKGHIVSNLGQDDFVLEEDGRPQTIRYFTRETDLPLTLGLLLDTSQSQRRVLEQERAASETFIDQVLRQDKDSAFLIHFDREVELLQDLTSSRQKLRAALDSLQVPQMERRSAGSPGSWPGSQGGGRGDGGMRGGGTTLYDAVYLASNELMKKQQGRKAVVILSDGVDNGSKVTLASAIESAQKTDTVIYSILFADEERPSGFGEGGFGGPFGGGMGRGGMGRRGGMNYPRESRPDGKKILEQMSNETGGRLFEVTKDQSVVEIYQRIQEELRNQYSIGYTSDRAPGVGYHTIQLKAKEKAITVQTRAGYYAEE